jgi:hypothetical protein
MQWPGGACRRRRATWCRGRAHRRPRAGEQAGCVLMQVRVISMVVHPSRAGVIDSLRPLAEPRGSDGWFRRIGASPDAPSLRTRAVRAPLGYVRSTEPVRFGPGRTRSLHAGTIASRPWRWHAVWREFSSRCGATGRPTMRPSSGGRDNWAPRVPERGLILIRPSPVDAGPRPPPLRAGTRRPRRSGPRL